MTQTTQLTAIVTGAARGIGLATTRLFLSKDYRVAMVDRDQHELQNASQGLDHVLPVNCDVSQEDQVNAIIHQMEEEKHISDAKKLKALEEKNT